MLPRIGVALLSRNDKIITGRMRVELVENDHAEFSFKASLRTTTFTNFGRRLDARLFIPAALRLASSTSLFAHLIGRSLLRRRFALCRMIIYPNATFFGDFTEPYKRELRIKFTFCPCHSLFLSISFALLRLLSLSLCKY